MKEKLIEMQTNLTRVASKMQEIEHPRTNEIIRVAQYFGSGMNMPTQAQSNPFVQQMADEQEDMGVDEIGNPGISSYVKMKPGEEPAIDDRKTHTCTVIFKSPDGVSEAEMMNYILGIGKALDVDVESFKWSKSDAKQVKPAV